MVLNPRISIKALLFFAIMPQEAGLEALGRHRLGELEQRAGSVWGAAQPFFLFRPAAGAGED